MSNTSSKKLICTNVKRRRDQNKLSNSWVDLESFEKQANIDAGFEALTINNVKEIICDKDKSAGKFEKFEVISSSVKNNSDGKFGHLNGNSNNNVSGTHCGASDISKNDLDQLGYVIPEAQPSKLKSLNTADNEVALGDTSWCAEAEIINHIDAPKFPSIPLEKSSGEPTSFYVLPTNTYESFYEVSTSDTLNLEDSKMASDRIAKPLPREFTNVINSDNFSSQVGLQNAYEYNFRHKPYSSLHPEFPEHSLSMYNRHLQMMQQSRKMVMSNSVDENSWSDSVPAPPPDLGLPDYTKKSHFPIKKYKETEKRTDDSDASTMVKSKVLGIWNNVKYGWSVNLGTNFSKSSPIVLLGKVFRPPFTSQYTDVARNIPSDSMTAFKDSFYSLPWFTYRNKLPVFQTSKGTELSSDCGWSCTLRCTQMMMCHALHLHFIGSNFTYTPGITTIPMIVHGCLVRWFGDGYGDDGICPISLHQMIDCASGWSGKEAGDWYSPSNASIAIRDAIENGSKYMPDLQRVTVYATVDNILYIQEVLDQCWTPCICKHGQISKYMKQYSDDRGKTLTQRDLSANFLSDSLNSPAYPLDNYESFIHVPGDVELQTEEEGGAFAHRGSADETEQSSGLPSQRQNTASFSKLFGSLKLPGGKKSNRLSVCNRVTGATARQESLETATLELLSPILEQEKLCSDCHSWKSVVVILAIRMGGESFNCMYEPVITALLRHSLCIGLVGGKARRAFYFVGYQDDHLLYLDPHVNQDPVNFSKNQLPDVQPYHCDTPKKMPINKLEPSATVAFYCHTRTDFLQLVVDLPKLTTVKEGSMCYPLVEVKASRDVTTGSMTSNSTRKASRSDDFQLLE